MVHAQFSAVDIMWRNLCFGTVWVWRKCPWVSIRRPIYITYVYSHSLVPKWTIKASCRGHKVTFVIKKPSTPLPRVYNRERECRTSVHTCRICLRRVTRLEWTMNMHVHHVWMIKCHVWMIKCHVWMIKCHVTLRRHIHCRILSFSIIYSCLYTGGYWLLVIKVCPKHDPACQKNLWVSSHWYNYSSHHVLYIIGSNFFEVSSGTWPHPPVIDGHAHCYTHMLTTPIIKHYHDLHEQ